MEGWNEYSVQEVARHNRATDCWVIIGTGGDKKVLDVTAFLEDHPGGPELLLDLAGQDVQDEFEDIGHSKEAHEMLQDLCIGRLKDDQHAREWSEARKMERISLLKHQGQLISMHSDRMIVKKRQSSWAGPLMAVAVVVAIVAVIITKPSWADPYASHVTDWIHHRIVRNFHNIQS
ncbi:hypothetical protein ATCC90586_001372 [Pythium insidiosum]|nr:hypothetical protein ATCC90586_001372 [Pythium insidiosum]